MITDFTRDGLWCSLYCSRVGHLSLSPCCSCQGEEGKEKEGEVGWSWVGQFVLAVAHCFLGFLESLPPWQTWNNMGGGGVLWGQQCLQNIWTVARSGGGWYFWTETAEKIFLLIVQQMKHLLVGVWPPTQSQKQTFNPFSLKQNPLNKNTTHFSCYQRDFNTFIS